MIYIWKISDVHVVDVIRDLLKKHYPDIFEAHMEVAFKDKGVSQYMRLGNLKQRAFRSYIGFLQGMKPDECNYGTPFEEIDTDKLIKLICTKQIFDTKVWHLGTHRAMIDNGKLKIGCLDIDKEIVKEIYEAMWEEK